MRSYYYFVIVFLLTVNQVVKCQTVLPQAPLQSSNPSGVTEDAARRVNRARALAAVGSLPLAASELEAVIKTEKDESIREVAHVLLIGIYLELSDYMQAQNILDQSFNARNSNKETSLRGYFTLAGHLVNTLRLRLNRYRAFNLNVSDSDLAPEGINDLNRLRQLLEHATDQAKEIMEKEPSISSEAAALVEDTASLRLLLARDGYERSMWSGEVAHSRQQLVAADPKILSWSRGVGARSKPTVMPTISASEFVTSQPSHSNNIQPLAIPSAPVILTPSVGALGDRATTRVQPVYPREARLKKITGQVNVTLVVGEAGEVVSIEEVNGPEILKQSVLDVIKKWKFQPVIIDGTPARVRGSLNFNFTL